MSRRRPNKYLIERPRAAEIFAAQLSQLQPRPLRDTAQTRPPPTSNRASNRSGRINRPGGNDSQQVFMPWELPARAADANDDDDDEDEIDEGEESLLEEDKATTDTAPTSPAERTALALARTRLYIPRDMFDDLTAVPSGSDRREGDTGLDIAGGIEMPIRVWTNAAGFVPPVGVAAGPVQEDSEGERGGRDGDGGSAEESGGCAPAERAKGKWESHKGRN